MLTLHYTSFNEQTCALTVGGRASDDAAVPHLKLSMIYLLHANLPLGTYLLLLLRRAGEWLPRY